MTENFNIENVLKKKKKFRRKVACFLSIEKWLVKRDENVPHHTYFQKHSLFSPEGWPLDAVTEQLCIAWAVLLWLVLLRDLNPCVGKGSGLNGILIYSLFFLTFSASGFYGLAI